jgi:hypothetical protein
MDNGELSRLRERISELSDEELRQMVEVDYDDYRPEAIEYAKSQMDARGLRYTSPPPTEDEDTDEDEEDEDYELPAPLTCTNCGAGMRLGYLFTERETTIIFADNSEQRFVEMHVCPRCGNVKIVIDMETEVEE